MYDAEYVKNFYDSYGNHEWSRLEATPYARLQAIIHEEFIQRYIKPGDRVLDAGSGPGRFSITATRVGAKVTLLDISGKQLEIARQKIDEAGLSENIEQFIEADICDLAMFDDSSFDMVICYGGALTYVCEKRQHAAGEIIRVTRPDGIILVSVMSHMGAILGVARLPYLSILKEPDKAVSGEPAFWPLLASGDLPGFPSKHINMSHASMHLFTADEIRALFQECMLLEIAGSNVTIEEFAPANEKIAAEPSAWATLVEMERKINHDPGLLNSGSHIIMAVKKINS